MSLHVHLVPSLVDARPGSAVEVDGAEAHHAVVVRRVRVGEQVALTDGIGTTVIGSVASAAKSLLTVVVDSVERTPRPEPRLVVVQALPKGDRGELAVEVLTEVGADAVVPWSAARCVTSWRAERGAKALTRWRSSAREAAKQARRSWFPEVTDLASTDDVVDLLAGGELAVVLHESAERPLAALDVPASGTVVLVVGPEGGLTDDEVEAFVAVGAHPVRLGGEVLRTSTAGLAAAAAVLARTSRWGFPGACDH